MSFSFNQPQGPRSLGHAIAIVGGFGLLAMGLAAVIGLIQQLFG